MITDEKMMAELVGFASELIDILRDFGAEDIEFYEQRLDKIMGVK